jgi:hypothetical protein
MVNILGNIACVPTHWFRIAYSRNAFLRHLAALGLELDTLTPEEGDRAMRSFMAEYSPQHAELDTLIVRGSTVTRRMQRHDHPVANLRLSFAHGAATLVQS